jgi:DNA-binding response OmpR family regulator
MADHGSRNQTVLVVDDEPMVREVVSAYLRREGYSTVEVGDGEAAVKAVEHHRPDLIVLDVMLPKLDGYSLLTELRKSTTVPVILLTARSEEVDRVLGFELGADDYVVKPFSPRELTARVKSVLRRSAPIDAPGVVHEFGDLTIDGDARETRIGGVVVDMPPLEFDVLMFLASNPRRVFSRAELLEKVWGSSAEWQDPSTVTVHVRRIRQKIEADPDDPTRIVTVWGKGYRFEP